MTQARANSAWTHTLMDRALPARLMTMSGLEARGPMSMSRPLLAQPGLAQQRHHGAVEIFELLVVVEEAEHHAVDAGRRHPGELVGDLLGRADDRIGAPASDQPLAILLDAVVERL